jgi:ribonuclease D
LEKHLQAHDWAERPFTPMQLEYLAGDVRHLFALDETLEADADKQGILPEVADECRYRLICALRGPKQRAAPWTRVDGYDRLDDAQRAVLVELWSVRDRLAAEQDVPPFRVAANALLCVLARRRPSTEAELRRAGGGRVMRHVDAWLAAVARGLDIGAPPVPSEPAEPRPPPEELARKKRLHGALLRWRKDESKRRSVDAQVVLPGHCTDALLDALARYGDDFAALLAALAAIEGLGDMRTRRYLGVWWGLAVAAFSYLPLVSSDEPLPE